MTLRFLGMLAAAAAFITLAAAGPLDPPAPPASTAGPEPRVAINAENTPGDGDSLFRIAQPGSYYLTSDFLGASGEAGIEIATSNVSLDLAGFSMIGVEGALDGVVCGLATAEAWFIANGTVRNWDDGIDAEVVTQCQVERITALDNRGPGINLGFESQVRDCIGSGNGGLGIEVDERSQVRDSQAHDNGGTGFAGSSDSLFDFCTAHDNGGNGFSIGRSGLMESCTSMRNSQGILAGEAATVRNCTVRDNVNKGMDILSGIVEGCQFISNGGDGVEIDKEGLIRGNVFENNGDGATDGAGINVIDSSVRIEENNCVQNDRGIDVDGTFNFIVRNTCTDNGAGVADNYAIAANNSLGPIVNVVGANNWIGITNSAHAWANYSY